MKNSSKSSKLQKEEKESQSFYSKYAHEIFFFSVVFICISLLSVVFVLTNQYSTVTNEQVQNKSQLNSSYAVEALTERINDLKYKSAIIAKDLSLCEEKKDLDAAALHAASVEVNLRKIVYRIGNTLVNVDKTLFKTSGTEKLQVAFSKNEPYFAGVITETSGTPMDYIAVCVPVEDSELIDSAIMCYTLPALFGLKKDMKAEAYEQASYIAFCNADGVALELLSTNNSLIPSNESLLSGIKRITNDAQSVEDLKGLMANDGGVIMINDNGTKYCVSVAKNYRYSEFCFVCIYNAEAIYTAGYNVIGIILTAFVVVLLIVLGFVIYFVLSKRKMNKAISELGKYNEKMKCLTKEGFESEGNIVLDEHKGSRFAVVAVGVRRFEFLTEVLGQDKANDVVRQILIMINSRLQIGEIYAYSGDGQSLILLQYGQTDVLMRRLNQLYRGVYNHFLTKQHNVKLNFGICPISRKGGENLTKVISNAELALEKGGFEKVDGNYTMYHESMRDSYLMISDLEIKMDQGIKSNEFKVFYQPKYNIDNDCVDGCEALVRWYDTATGNYRAPDSFLPLFESNGFIARLDNFVFLHVCSFIYDRVSQGMPVIPVSVNVSRFTMLEEDFVDNYVKIKKQYQIPDGFITLEFTESAAYENNAVLEKLATTLRKNGFLCSIDDFGTGYSSYNMLKVLDIDEVKLDRFFIEGCLTNKRAKSIIEGAVSIGNNLKLKVTQEGVEDEATFNYLKNIGCNVIQGYYYSLPLNESDFVVFINEHIKQEK